MISDAFGPSGVTPISGWAHPVKTGEGLPGHRSRGHRFTCWTSSLHALSLVPSPVLLIHVTTGLQRISCVLSGPYHWSLTHNLFSLYIWKWSLPQISWKISICLSFLTLNFHGQTSVRIPSLSNIQNTKRLYLPHWIISQHGTMYHIYLYPSEYPAQPFVPKYKNKLINRWIDSSVVDE